MCFGNPRSNEFVLLFTELFVSKAEEATTTTKSK
jgi:hypothetical protein